MTRWQELEETVKAPALPTDYLAALKQLVCTTELMQEAQVKALQLEHKVQADAPKVPSKTP